MNSPITGYITSPFPTKEYETNNLAANPMGSSYHDGQLTADPMAVVPPNIDIYGEDTINDREDPNQS